MRAIAAVAIIAIFAGIVAGLAYGATQVDPGAWTYAVVAVSTGVGVSAACSGVARIVAARHAPPEKRLYQIDKAVFTASQIEPPQF